MKKFWKAITLVTVLLIDTIALTACSPNDKKYFEKVSNYSFWDNKASEAIAQYKNYHIMDAFLSDGEIVNGNVVKDGKTKKVLFVGWDGVRADALTNIFYDENSFNTNEYNYEASTYSGLHELKKTGGLYMAYSGGEKGKDSEQSSSTCASWTSQLTGDWNTLHGVKENPDVMSKKAETIMLKYAKKGLNTGLSFDWGDLFDVTFRNEVSYLIDNPTTPMIFADIDRKPVTDKQGIMAQEGYKKEEDIKAIDVAHYNQVAMKGEIHPQAKYDIASRDYLLSRIEAGDDFVGGIFHRPDTNGHTTGFTNENNHYVNSVRNADIYLYEILQVIKEREATMNEEWLVICTTDHGGSGQDHGKQVFEHRTTWIATNKPIDAKYFGKNYNGYTEG